MLNNRLLKIFIFCILCCSIFFVAFVNSSFINNNIVVKIGRKKVSSDEYKRHYKNNMRYIAEMVGGELSDNYLEMIDLKKITLDNILDKGLVYNFIKYAGLDISEEAVIEQIKTIHYFFDENGAFSLKKFQALLEQNNISEKEYTDDIKYSIIEFMLMDIILSNFGVNDLLINTLLDYRFETRSADIFLVDKDNFTTQDYSPNKEEIQNFFDDNKDDFFAPEYRKIDYVMLDKNSLDGEVSISEEDIRSEYEKNKDVYESYKSFDIVNVIFTSNEELEKYYYKLKGNFDNTLELLKNKDGVSVNYLENILTKDLPDDFQKIISGMHEEEVSDVISSPLGLHIVKLNKIIELNDVLRARILEDIKNDLLNNKIHKTFVEKSEKIEKDLLDGLLIDDIVAKYSLKIQSSDYFDKYSIGINGKYVELNYKLIEKVFESDADVPNSSHDADSMHIVFVVKDIKEIREKNIEEVESVIVEKLQKKHQDNLLLGFTKEVHNKIVSGSLMHDLSNSILPLHDNKIYRHEVVEKMQLAQNYPSELVDELFHKKIGDTTSYYKQEDGSYVIAVLNGVNKAESDNLLYAEQIKADMFSVQKESLYNDFYNYARQKFKVKVYEKKLANLQ